MQGRKVFIGKSHPEVRLETRVRPDHEVRRRAKVLDLSWVYAETLGDYSHTGQPSLDPGGAVKILLRGFFENIPSERKLMKRIADTPAFRWYISYDLDERLPDPSDLSKFRRRLGPGFFQTLLARVIELGEAAGLVKNEAFLMDSTRVAAAAGAETARTVTLRSKADGEALERGTGRPTPVAFPPGSFCPCPPFTLLAALRPVVERPILRIGRPGRGSLPPWRSVPTPPTIPP